MGPGHMLLFVPHLPSLSGRMFVYFLLASLPRHLLDHEFIDCQARRDLSDVGSLLYIVDGQTKPRAEQ